MGNLGDPYSFYDLNNQSLEVTAFHNKLTIIIAKTTTDGQVKP